MNFSANNHLSQDLVVRTLDDELTVAERFACEPHLAVCESCRSRLASMHRLSLEIDGVVHATVLSSAPAARHQLIQALERKQAPALPNSAGRVLRRFGWGMGIAAALAFGILLAPRDDWPARTTDNLSNAPSGVQANGIEVNGEVFVPVSYSNPDLSTPSPHIVQMQVPVSSLADAGIVWEPILSRRGGTSDVERSVLADVLVGADGQPLGVHVIGID
jgi:hypothetical protein